MKNWNEQTLSDLFIPKTGTSKLCRICSFPKRERANSVGFVRSKLLARVNSVGFVRSQNWNEPRREFYLNKNNKNI
ncbi:MAG: hypothetical protein LBQ28_09910 [Prevotellaceae bacterium]|nr:hypothetical protein [Prevotellaceae bacterium]